MKKTYPPTTSAPIIGAFLPLIHANSVNLNADSGGVLTIVSIGLLILGLIIIIASFIWQIKIDKDKRKW